MWLMERNSENYIIIRDHDFNKNDISPVNVNDDLYHFLFQYKNFHNEDRNISKSFSMILISMKTFFNIDKVSRMNYIFCKPYLYKSKKIINV